LRSKTDVVAKGKYDHTEATRFEITKRVHELAEKHQATMAQISIAWQWAKGVAAPIIGATKAKYLDDAAGAFDVN
jgi:aryl-alcohol dehydrogenase-like predicted oxidoreductase